MKKIHSLRYSVLLALGALLTLPAHATVIDFEQADVSNGLTVYQGFTWQNMFAFPGALMPGTGYSHGLTSGSNIAFNGGADTTDGAKTGSFWSSDGARFSLQSINVTKAWNAGTTRFIGYVDGAPTLIQDVVATTAAPTHAVFNWHGLSRIDIVDLDKSMQSVFDDIRVNDVPEPAPLTVMLAGLAALAFLRRRAA